MSARVIARSLLSVNATRPCAIPIFWGRRPGLAGHAVAAAGDARNAERRGAASPLARRPA